MLQRPALRFWNLSRIRQLAIVLSAVSAIGISGCSRDSAAPSGGSTPETMTATTRTEAVKDTESPAAETKDVAEVTLRVSTFDELQATIQKHKGKVVVCDFWSTSCDPCVREFPHLIKLSHAYPADKVVCISASLDFDGLNPIDNYKAPVLKFLNEQQAKIDNLLFSEEDTEIYGKLKIASIPAVFVYGTDGERKKVFDESSGKEFTYEKDINPFVADLVKTSFESDK